jgi:hypothetical protein
MEDTTDIAGGGAIMSFSLDAITTGTRTGPIISP